MEDHEITQFLSKLIIQRLDKTMIESQVSEPQPLQIESKKKGLSNLRKGLSYYNMKRLDEAFTQLKKSIGLNPKRDQAHCLLASVLIKQKKYKEAEEVMENAFSIHLIDKTHFSHFTMGILHFKQEDYSSSLLDLSTSLRLSFNSKEKEYNGRRFYYIARSMIKKGIKTEDEKDEIKKILTDTITANKEWSKGYYRRVEFYLSLLKLNQLNEKEGYVILSDLQSSLHYNSSVQPIYQLSTKKIKLIRHSIQLQIHNQFHTSNVLENQEKNYNNNNDINNNGNDNKESIFRDGREYSLMNLKVNSNEEEIDYFTKRLHSYLGDYSGNQICVVCIVLFGIEFTITRRKIVKKSEESYQISRDNAYQLPFSNSDDSISLTFPFSSSYSIR